MTVVMGLDEHRAQITAEWLDTETGGVIPPLPAVGVGSTIERRRRRSRASAARGASVGLLRSTDVADLLGVNAAVSLLEPLGRGALLVSVGLTLPRESAPRLALLLFGGTPLVLGVLALLLFGIGGGVEAGRSVQGIAPPP